MAFTSSQIGTISLLFFLKLTVLIAALGGVCVAINLWSSCPGRTTRATGRQLHLPRARAAGICLPLSVDYVCVGLVDCASDNGYREISERDRTGQRLRISKMAYRSFRMWLITIALLGVAVDQAGKYLVFQWLHEPSHFNSEHYQGQYELIPGVFRLHAQYTGLEMTPHVNKGALFGLGNEGAPLHVSPDGANRFFAIVSIAAALAIVVWSFARRTAGDRLLCIALGLILAGTIGNLYDRIVFHGVRDFLYYYYLINWPVFNLADCCLVVGAFLLLGQAFFTQKAQSTATATAPASVPQPVITAPEVARLG